MQLVIGNKNYSSWSLRPWLLLSYFSIEFSEEQIWLSSQTTSSQMQGKCPNAKVPVLIDRGHKIWDSLAICEYLNEQQLEGKGWPKDRVKRSIARSICAEMHASFSAIRGEMPMNCRRPRAAITITHQAQSEITRIIEIFEDCLVQGDQGFLFNQFSIADAFYMPIIVRFNSYAIKVPESVHQYMQRMLALPAYRAWLIAARAEGAVIAEEEL